MTTGDDGDLVVPPFNVEDINDGGQAVVRVKPLGAGGGGVEHSSHGGASNVVADCRKGMVCVAGREFTYPAHVLGDEHDNQAVFREFMPARIAGFLAGYDVNVMAHGQTGSGKTHTMFGPPGIMERAGAGKLGDGVHKDYGLFPRAVIATYHAVQKLRAESGGARSFVLTASAVELAGGNLDMVVKSRKERAQAMRTWSWTACAGVALDKKVHPPRLYGMVEVELDSMAAVQRMFRAIASRNTAATGMNDASSRSHCFVWLTLRAYDRAEDAVRTSRMQFVDLAGSERLAAAHGDATVKDGNMELINGMITNFSLSMLSTAVRAMVRSKRSKARVSSRSFLVDLVALLEQSLTGTAITAVFICISQAPANASQSKHSLDFGSQFAKLPIGRKRAARWRKVRGLADELEAESRAHLAMLAAGIKGARYQALRGAMATDCAQQARFLKQLKDRHESRHTEAW